MSSCSSGSYSFLHRIDEQKLFTFITSMTFAVIFIFIYILRRYTFFEKRGIPRGTRPSAPFGNIKGVLFQDTTLYVYLWKYYNRFKRKGYKYGGLYLFFRPSVLIVNPELITRVLSEDRRFTDLYGKKCVKDYGNFTELCTDKILNKFLARYNNNKYTITDLSGDNITTVLHNFLMDTACSAFGFNSLEVLDTANSLLKEKSRSGFLHYFHLVYPSFKMGSRSTGDLQNYLQNMMDLRKKNDIREDDIIQAFIDILNEVNDSFSVNEAAEEMFDIFVDNLIYSYSTLLFCLYELAVNEDVQQDAIGEIRRHKKQKNQITEDSLKALTYLDMVIKETLRKYPPVPIVFNKCEEDYNIPDVDLRLPKGTFVFVSIFGIHHDLDNFPDPEKFNPDRFSEENMKFVKPNTYLPFGYSLRRDIGIRLTTTQIKLGLLNILSSFSVSLDKSHTLAFNNKKLPVCPEEPLPLKFEPLKD